jgi:hypothetical protein
MYNRSISNIQTESTTIPTRPKSFHTSKVRQKSDIQSRVLTKSLGKRP